MDLRALLEKRDAECQTQLEERDQRYEADRPSSNRNAV